MSEKTAVDLVSALRAQEITPHDLLDALEQQIAAVEPAVNALPILCFDRARKNADRLLQRPVETRGILCGLPVPIKDLDDVAGVRTTFGSPDFASHIAPESCYMVEQLEAEGAVIYAKSNTPEFGAGGNTFNDVHGPTLNPRDTRLSVAGSSGGAAAALASGTAWLAQGSDNAGSLRSPASFCGIVGFRPTPGRVVRGPSVNPYQTLLSNGPMARNVQDVALFLDVMTSEDPRDPLSLPVPATPFLAAAQSRRNPGKVAFSPNLGITPVDPEIADICQRAAMQFEDMGVVVEQASPDFSGVHECYKTLRAFEFSLSMSHLPDDTLARLKPELAENLAIGRGLGFDDISRATQTRASIHQRVQVFFETYDLLLTPTTIVPPFPVEERFVQSCDGQVFSSYLDWLAIAYAVTLVSLPALSLPCGFTKTGMPVGLQMIGPARSEAAVLSYALVLEEALALDIGIVKPTQQVAAAVG
ncbi:amidase [Profundibacter amoris]|uniref:amidase n=1 Tax=Profundibacter amoris TaxID=2171755 RepID=UPI001E330EBE|nr:amidase family protein [Profundibacter amoris]